MRRSGPSACSQDAQLPGPPRLPWKSTSRGECGPSILPGGAHPPRRHQQSARGPSAAPGSRRRTWDLKDLFSVSFFLSRALRRNNVKSCVGEETSSSLRTETTRGVNKCAPAEGGPGTPAQNLLSPQPAQRVPSQGLRGTEAQQQRQGSLCSWDSEGPAKSPEDEKARRGHRDQSSAPDGQDLAGSPGQRDLCSQSKALWEADALRGRAGGSQR